MWPVIAVLEPLGTTAAGKFTGAQVRALPVATRSSRRDGTVSAMPDAENPEPIMNGSASPGETPVTQDATPSTSRGALTRREMLAGVGGIGLLAAAAPIAGRRGIAPLG